MYRIIFLYILLYVDNIDRNDYEYVQIWQKIRYVSYFSCFFSIRLKNNLLFHLSLSKAVKSYFF